MISRKLNSYKLRRLLSSIERYSSLSPFLWNLLNIKIDGTKIQDITIDGNQVQEVTVDGNSVWTNVNVNEITTDVTLNGQSIDITIYEDTDGDGNAENTETINVDNGTNTYNLSNLDGSAGNTCWIKWTINNSNITKTAKANYADLQNVGTWNTASEWNNRQSQNGVVHENVSNTDHNDATIIKQGYSINDPLYSSNLVRYYPLHESSGNTAYDFSGNNNDGIYSGAGPDGTGTGNGILNSSSPIFDGSNDYINIPTGINLFDGSSNYTVSTWVKLDSVSSGKQQIFAPTAENSYLFGFGDSVSDDKLSVRRENGSGSWGNPVASTTTFTTNKWYFVSVTYDSSNGYKLYVNANSEDTAGSESISGGFASNNQLGSNGGGDTANNLAGKIAEARIYNKTLSSSEIQTLYNVVATKGTLTTNTKSS